jgi:hypothetical protein
MISVTRIASRISGDVWDAGPSWLIGFEGSALELEPVIGPHEVRQCIIQGFNIAFGTNHDIETSATWSGAEEMDVDELIHELLHEAFDVKFLKSGHDSALEAASDEMASRNYGLFGGDTPSAFSDALTIEMGIPDEDLSPEEAEKLLQKVREDISMCNSKEWRPLLERFLKKLEYIIKQGSGLTKEERDSVCNAAESAAGKARDEHLPPDLERKIRTWFRWAKREMDSLASS